MEKLVFVGAHPDDTEGYAATAALLRETYEIHVVDLTRGELGLGRPGLLDGSTARRRVKEEENACALLGATPHFLAEIDGDACASMKSVDLLAALLDELRPRAVFTHWPVDSHTDHVQTAAVVTHALHRLDYAPETYYFEVDLGQTSNYRPLYYVDVSATMELKAAVLRKYECQNPGDHMAQDNLKRAAIRGAECVPSVKYAETFTTFDGQPIRGGVIDALAVPGLPLMVDAVDGPLSLPDYNDSAWAFNKGCKPAGITANECAVYHALVAKRLVVTTVSGKRLWRDAHYKLEPDWGSVGLLPEAPHEPVRLHYAYMTQRIDSVVEKDGVRTRRFGEPHVATPKPPALADGEKRIENILVNAAGELHLPLAATAADAPRAASNAATAIPRTLAKLRAGEPVKLLAWGDSVTACGYLPDADKWQEQFARRLRLAFPKSSITLVSNGWGGRTSKAFLDEPSGSPHHFEETVVAVKPDLVVSEFVNDAGLPQEMLEDTYGKVLARFRAEGIEWAVLTPHYTRCDWMGLEKQADCDDDPRPYVTFLRHFARENDVGLADAALRWGHLWREGIPFESLFANSINHPDAFGMSFFADALMDFFGASRN